VPAGSGIIASFLVDGHKRVVSLGTIDGGMALQMDRRSTTITGSGLHLSFGDCTMDTRVIASGQSLAEGATVGN
jgi:hypothetical protein